MEKARQSRSRRLDRPAGYEPLIHTPTLRTNVHRKSSLVNEFESY